MLRLLSLLQTHRFWSGGELSERLEVSARTLRRDIDRLRELGYHVDAVRGVAGGYQLRAGGSLPPLLLEDEEAVAIAVSLHQAAGGATPGLEETAVQALTKVSTLMPPRLRRRMDALRTQTDNLVWSGGPVVDPELLTTLAQACRDDEPLQLSYVARDGAETERRVEPHRLVSLGRRWYLVAYDRDRTDWRSFRVDRVATARTTGQRFRPRDLPGGDALTFVQSGIRRMPQRYDVRVRIAADVAAVERIAGRWATVSGTDGDCLVELGVDALHWPLMMLADVAVELDASFVVESPPELRAAVAAVAHRFGATAGATAGAPQ